MSDQDGQAYYLSHEPDILALFDAHAEAWRPFLVARYDDQFTNAVLREARERFIALIPDIPYIGGDENPMTRHLVRSTTSLVLYKAMQARGKTAEETGKVLFDAVAASVRQLPAISFELTPEFVAREREQARKSQERRYPGDWVWEFIEGDGTEFDYGCDFWECATYKLYNAHHAGGFLPFYCYLDFAMHRTAGWGFARSMTLAEGYPKCAFRWKKGGETRVVWPPPFRR